MHDIDRLIEAWEIFRDSNPYELCKGMEFRAISEPEYCMGQMIEDTLALLKEQKAVEPKTGHWIYLQFCANEGVYCSECHTKMFDRYPMKKKLSQFCGHCGAKMDDEVEGR